MKKMAAVFLFVMIAGVTYPKDLILGVMAGFDPYTMGNKIGNDANNYNGEELYFNEINAGVFFDAQYIRLNVGYSMGLGDVIVIKRTVLSGGALVPVPTNYSKASSSMLSFDLILKLPLYIGIGNIWIGAGAGYRMMLGFDYNGDSVDDLQSTYTELNDFYLLGAAGLDINIFGLIIAPQISFGYNLTPKAGNTVEVPGGFNSYWLYEYKYSVGLGFEF